MKTVHKYTLQNFIEMPLGAEILHAQPQGTLANIQLWALVDTEAPMVMRRFEIVGTGHELVTTDKLKHITTFQGQYNLIFHVFEVSA